MQKSAGTFTYFGRMLDKIRLHAEGALPPDETIIDHIEYDEGRDLAADRAWKKI